MYSGKVQTLSVQLTLDLLSLPLLSRALLLNLVLVPAPLPAESYKTVPHLSPRPRLPGRKMALRKPTTGNLVQLTLPNLTLLVRDLSFPLYELPSQTLTYGVS